MKPLQNITVIDMTTNISGPTLTMILGDLGAEVIKIEKPSGDEARKMEPRLNEDGVYFLNINRQKKSVVLDLKQEAHLKKLHELIKQADVFVENFRFGITKKLKIDYETMKLLNEKIIYCSLSAYGQNGPKKEYPGYDAIMQAETGIMSVTGNEEIARVPVSLIDQGSAMWGAIGIISAILQRVQTNEGCYISTSLYETGVFWANYHLLATKLTKIDPEKLGSNHGAFAPYGAFETADGTVMIGISNNKLFEMLCEALNEPSWMTDEQYSSNTKRVQNRKKLNQAISKRTKLIQTTELISMLEKKGVPVAKVQTMSDVLQDEQQIENELIVSIPHSRDGEMFATRLPLQFSTFNAAPTKAAPILGEHTAEILRRIEQHDIK